MIVKLSQHENHELEIKTAKKKQLTKQIKQKINIEEQNNDRTKNQFKTNETNRYK